MSDASDAKKRPPYARYAFLNPYNLSLLAGAAVAAAATGDWVLGVVAAGAEAVWMLLAPDSRLLRRFVWDKKHAAELAAAQEADFAANLAELPDKARHRCLALRERQREIDRLCAENPRFTAELLRGELAKLDSLVQSFLELSLSSARYLAYLDNVDVNELERETRRYAGIVDHLEEGDPQRELAMKNLGVLQRRRAKLAEIRQSFGTARAQLDLIENTFKLLADQIVTMRSPAELSGQLDALMSGVETIQETTRETEKLLQAIER